MSLAQYRDRPHWSYSSLNQLLNICSLQWYFEKVERVPRDATPLPLAFGSAYHRTMEWMAEQRMNGGLPKEPDVRERFNAAWSRQCELEKNVAQTPSLTCACTLPLAPPLPLPLSHLLHPSRSTHQRRLVDIFILNPLPVLHYLTVPRPLPLTATCSPGRAR